MEAALEAPAGIAAGDTPMTTPSCPSNCRVPTPSAQAADNVLPTQLLVRGRAALVAIVGNPNTGKTALFNTLTGFRRHVANYPGVTVDAARGPIRGSRRALELLDLPGTYSLEAASPDEALVADVLSGRSPAEARPDVVLAVVDASNPTRSVYLVSHLLDLGLPLVVAVNMVDVAAARGIGVDCERLAERLGVAVVPIVAVESRTVRPLIEALEAAVGAAPPPRPATIRTADALDDVQARYAWAADVLEGVVSRPAAPVATWSDRLDAVLTHRVAGAAFLAIVLFFVFQSLFVWASPLMEAIDRGVALIAAAVAGATPPGVVRSLLCDGVIAGVGGVLVFLPQIMLLFGLIAILEDSGYMARAAYMMDRVMRALGLSGRSFLPLLSSFACAVPAILGTRTIADRRERFVTILVAPFMSCSARLPVYVLMTSAFVPATRFLGGWVSLQGLVLLGAYAIGVIVAVPLAWLLKRTAFAGPAQGFLLELPSYKRPRLRAVWQRMAGAGRDFVVRAGTVILLVNLIVWALGYFPRAEATRIAVERRAAVESWDERRCEHELAGAYLRESFLGRMGRALEPAVEPIGWDWRIGMAVAASFPAREVVVATLGTIYNLGAGESEQSESLQAAIANATWPHSDRPVFTLPVALSLIVFFALCAQCASTLAVIARETRSWSWSLASFTGMTAIAYLAAWATAAAARAAGL